MSQHPFRRHVTQDHCSDDLILMRQLMPVHHDHLTSRHNMTTSLHGRVLQLKYSNPLSGTNLDGDKSIVSFLDDGVVSPCIIQPRR